MNGGTLRADEGIGLPGNTSLRLNGEAGPCAFQKWMALTALRLTCSIKASTGAVAAGPPGGAAGVAPSAVRPNSAGADFYVCYWPQSQGLDHLDGYAVFAQVVKGKDVIDHRALCLRCR